ncbi:MAG: endo-1,4-beta-xylanase [Streptosporangiaceae bacterium]|nr:endo-1,4-beta-xylanase [Streptosporangiaceae bacterium]MBV9855889.1 endo-1,4-beta-xylanase [Streptosporangiaceae bacterium]
MRHRRLLAAGAVGTVVVAAALGISSAAGAAPSASAPRASAPRDEGAPDSLRALAAKIGLRIGTAVIPFDLNTPAYRDIVADQFSVVTPGNEMKWQVVEPTRGTYDWSGGDRLVKFAEEHGQLVRGHTLLWHNQLPAWLTTGVANGTISDTELRALLHKHVIDEVTHFKGKIWQWDVANEFFTDSNPSGINPNDFWVSHLGAGIIAEAFRWAHQADPHALLFYNDYNIAGEDGTNAKSDAVYAWLRQMLAEGVPINGVGDQGHLDTQYGFPTQMTQDLRRYASLGLKVAITEADVRTFVNNPTAQVPTDHLATFAQPYEFSQMLKACLAVRQCISFTVWGFGDADSWIPGFFTGEGYATIYDVNLQPKPAYFDLQQDLQLAAYGAPHRVHTDQH